MGGPLVSDFPVSLPDLKPSLPNRGAEVDHTTVLRRFQAHAAEIGKPIIRPHLRPCDGWWRSRLTASARKIPPEQLRCATITLSNFAMIAAKYAAPIVVPATVAIRGAGRNRRQAIVAGALAIRRILALSPTFDRRVVTGGEAAHFLAGAIDDPIYADRP